MSVGVVVSCYRQERLLARTVASIERALAGEEWAGVLELAVPADEPLPPLSPRWRVVSAFDPLSGRPGRPLTPGAGRMLGLASCPGDWVLFADSDIEVDPEWMRRALATARREPGLAGLTGRLEEWFVDGATERPGAPDLYRVGRADRPMDFLATLVLYRREALLAAGGYDPRLNSDEDFELGLRLLRRGWAMRSLGCLAGRHWSAPRPSFGELGRRWRTGICFGQGQVLRLYLLRPGFLPLLRRQWLFVATTALWALGPAALAAWALTGDGRAFAAWVCVPPAVVLGMGLHKRSLGRGLLSLLTWSVQGLGMVVGFFRLPAGARPLSAAEAGS
jgi:hypothetical protein